MKSLRKWILALLALGVIGTLIFLSMQPTPIDVDLVEVTRGPLVVTVSDDGRTRIRDRYVISSPVQGRLSRIALEEGDAVEANTTRIATIRPTDPQLLNTRARTQAEARVNAAQAAMERAEADLERAQSTDRHAQAEAERHQALFAQDLISESEHLRYQYDAQSAAAGLKSAGKGLEIARHDLEQAQAALAHTQESDRDTDTREWFEITAPIGGHILRVLQESSAVVTPGQPLVELGDPTDLEVIVDVLSTDAVKIRSGNRVLLEHWGGDGILNGIVNRVEPSAFTKISALGVEEQRVWVIIDFTDPPEARTALGDGFRIEPQVVIWEADDVIKVATGALFRKDGDWAVFRVTEDGEALLTPVEVGQSDGFETEIRSGLTPSTRVIVHPSARVEDHGHVVARGE